MLSQSIRSEGLMRVSKPSSSRQPRRIGRIGQGIIEANRKTEICRHWLTGSCPFGAKCAFAHGAGELRNHSLDTKCTSRIPNGSKINDLPCGQTGVTTASCICGSRCTVGNDGGTLPRSEKLSPQLSISANDHHDTHGSACDMDLYWMSNSRRPEFLMDVRSRASCNCNQLGPQTPDSNANRVDDRAAFSLWHSTNPTLDSPSRDRRTSVDVPFRNGDHFVGGANASDNAVSSIAATVDTSLRTAQGEDDTWANVARGSFGGRGSTDYCRRGCGPGAAGENVVTSDKCVPLVDHDRHRRAASTSPMVDELSFFQARRCSSHVSSTASSSRCATTSVGSDSSTSVSTASWDPSTSNAPFFRAGHTPLRSSARNISTPTPSTHRIPTQHVTEGLSGSSASSLQDMNEPNAVARAPMLPWWSVPPLLEGEADTTQKLQLDMAGFPSTSRLPRTNSTQSVAENICPGPEIGSSDTTPHYVGWEPLVTYGQKPSGHSFKDEGIMFQVVSTNIPVAQQPTMAWGAGSSGKPGRTVGGRRHYYGKELEALL